MQNVIWPAAVSTTDVDRKTTLRQLPNYSLVMRPARSAVYIWAWLSQFLQRFARCVTTRHTKYYPTHVIQFVGVVGALVPYDKW